MAKVLIPLANGFEETEAVAVIDVLRRAGVEVVTAALEAPLDVHGAHGMILRADARLDAVLEDEYEAIVLPGGGEGTERLKNCEPLLRRIVRQREEERLLCAICAAPTVLQEAGVLDVSHHVTSYPTCQMEFDCNWVNEPVVEHDGFVTSQGPGTALEFAITVVGILLGEKAAVRVARGMLVEF